MANETLSSAKVPPTRQGTKLDRVTSRQLLDQQAIEARVQELMARQDSIGQRSSRMTNLLDAAKTDPETTTDAVSCAAKTPE